METDHMLNREPPLATEPGLSIYRPGSVDIMET